MILSSTSPLLFVLQVAFFHISLLHLLRFPLSFFHLRLLHLGLRLSGRTRSQTRISGHDDNKVDIKCSVRLPAVRQGVLFSRYSLFEFSVNIFSEYIFCECHSLDDSICRENHALLSFYFTYLSCFTYSIALYHICTFCNNLNNA